MALSRFQNLPSEQQTRILEVAAAAFAEQGYEGCSYNELLRTLGLGKSQAYYYFADKADLFLTAAASCYERYYEQTATLPLPRDAACFWDYVRELNLLGCRFLSSDPIASKLTKAALSSEVRFRLAEALTSSEGTSREQHRRWVKLGQELGAVRRDLPEDFLVRLSLEFSQFVDGYYAERALSAGAAEQEHCATLFTDLMQRLFQPAAPSTSAGPFSASERDFSAEQREKR